MASSCGSKMRKYSKGGSSEVSIKDFMGHPINHTTKAIRNMSKNKGNEEFENSKLARDFMNEMYEERERNRQQSRGPTSRRRANRENRGYAAGGPISDEERYGKVGAAIRKLDPEAYANRKDKSAEANLALLKQLREKDKAAQKSTRVESAEESMRTGKPMKDSGFTAVRAPSSGPTTRGGARRPAPAAPVARPSQGASRREFGQDLRGSGMSQESADRLKTAGELALTAASAYPAVRAGRAAYGAYKGYKATKAGVEAAKAARDKVLRPNAAESLRESRRIADEFAPRPTPPRARKIGSGRTTNKNAGGSIKKYAAGGAVRGDGICRVKTKGRMR